MPPAPHPGLFSVAAKSGRLIAGGLLLVAGVIMLAIGIDDIRTVRRYRDEARLIRAKVVEKWMEPATSIVGTRYRVTYRMPPADAPLERTQLIDVLEWESLEPGAEIDVHYLGGEPGSIRIARDEGIGGLAAAGASLASIGLVLAAFGTRDVRRRMFLYEHGTTADATITGVDETDARINRRQQWRVPFTYRDALGREPHGQSGYPAAHVAHEWQVGEPARLLFDRERPELIRDRRAWSQVTRFLRPFGAIWFLVGGSFLVAGLYLFSVERRFARDAQVGEGIVLTKDVSTHTSRGRTSRTYSVRYRLTDPAGRTVEGESDVPYERWLRIAERQPTEIEFLRSDPSRHRLRGAGSTTLAAIFTALGGSVALACAVIAGLDVRSTRRRRRLPER